MIYIDKKTYLESIKSEDTFECDDLIAPIITILNKKGFTTEFCCEGHWEWTDTEHISSMLDVPYITFVVGFHLPNIPDGWHIDVSTTMTDEDDNVIEGYWESIQARKLLEAENEMLFNAYKIEALYNLLKWAESLPNIF